MIRAFLHRLRNAPWLLSGVLLFACYPPVARHAYIAFALAPMLLMVRRRAPGFCFRWCFLSGFLYWFATLRWVFALKDMLGNNALVILLGWAALAAYCALYFGLFGALAACVWRWTRARGYGWRLAAMLVAEPVLWAGLELVRSRALTGFAWNHLGTVPVVMGFGAPAAFGGVYLLSMLVVLANGAVASILERLHASFAALRRAPCADAAPEPPPYAAVPRYLRSVETLLPFAVIFAVYFGARARVAAQVESADVLLVALFQRNFPPPFTDPRRARALAGDVPGEAVYGEMAAGVAPWKPALLVLSESAMAEISDDVGSPRAVRFAEGLLRASGATAAIAGGARCAGAATYNSAALYAGDGGVQVYDKVHLVPFGEYVPGASLVPALKNLLPMPSCTPGEVRTLDFAWQPPHPDLPAQTVRAGVGICYEDTDSALMRRLAEKGARMLVFITNDSWFYGSDEPVQHAWQSVARAIETGLPVVRVGNYGVTGVVDPHGGRARQCLARWLVRPDGAPKVDERERMVCGVTLASGLGELTSTFYVRWGDKPLAAAFLLLILAMCVVKYRHDHEERRKLPVQLG